MNHSSGPDDAANVLLVTPDWDTAMEHCTSGITTDSRVLIISYARPAEEYIAPLRESAAECLEEIVVIEARRNSISPVPEGVDVRSESPDRPTGVGMQTNELLTRWRDCDESIVIYFDSVTALLQYVELDGVYRFLHTFTGQVHQTDARGYYRLATGAHDEPTVGTLEQLFDTVLTFDSDTG